MRVAICFSGQARNTEYTHENIKENLIGQFEGCDTFFHISEDGDSDKIKRFFPEPTSLIVEKDTPIEEAGLKSLMAGL